METNEEKDFDKNSKEIKEFSLKLKEPLKNPFTILYYDDKKEKIKYKGEYTNKKYDGRGILYDTNGEMIYNGYFKNNEYDGFGNEFKYGKLAYEGFFTNGEKNGKGLLYYNNSEQIFFNGIFGMSKYIEGISYEPNGYKIYEGIFINNRPKEGKKLKLYKLDGELEYEGDFLNGNYHGYGTLYEKGKYEYMGKINEYKYLKYIGEFKDHKYNGHGKLYFDHYLGKYLFYDGTFDNNIFSGNGKIYYQNKKIFYEGQFENNDVNGKGIKYYRNGIIKIDGNFENNICLEGRYYVPNGKIIYEGEFKNDIPKESKKIIIYDNNTNKIYEGEVHDGKYDGPGIEYCPLIKDKKLFEGNFKSNFFIIPISSGIKEQNKEYIPQIILISHIDIPGKTCLLYRLKDNTFKECCLATIGIYRL